jgi:hypothetical protein
MVDWAHIQAHKLSNDRVLDNPHSRGNLVGLEINGYAGTISVIDHLHSSPVVALASPRPWHRRPRGTGGRSRQMRQLCPAHLTTR